MLEELMNLQGSFDSSRWVMYGIVHGENEIFKTLWEAFEFHKDSLWVNKLGMWDC